MGQILHGTAIYNLKVTSALWVRPRTLSEKKYKTLTRASQS
jgi:hypothetical protein